MAVGDVIKGTGGSFKVGPVGAPIVVGKIDKWTFKTERSSEDVGPFVGEDVVYVVVGGKKGTLEFEGIMPEGSNTGQDSVISNYEAGTPLRTEAVVTLGKTITFAAGAYSSLEISLDAKGTPRIKASLGGAYAISASV